MLPDISSDTEVHGFTTVANKEISLYGQIADEFSILDEMIEFYTEVRTLLHDKMNIIFLLVRQQKNIVRGKELDKLLLRVYKYLQRLAKYLSDKIPLEEGACPKIRLLYPLYLGITRMISTFPLYDFFLLPK